MLLESHKISAMRKWHLRHSCLLGARVASCHATWTFTQLKNYATSIWQKSHVQPPFHRNLVITCWFSSIYWIIKNCWYNIGLSSQILTYLKKHLEEQVITKSTFSCVPNSLSGPCGSFRVRIPRWTPNPSVGFSTPLLPTAIWRTAAYGSRGVCCSPSSTFGCCSSSNSRSIYK